MIEEDQDDLAKEKEEDKGEVKEEWSRRLQENYQKEIIYVESSNKRDLDDEEAKKYQEEEKELIRGKEGQYKNSKTREWGLFNKKNRGVDENKSSNQEGGKGVIRIKI